VAAGDTVYERTFQAGLYALGIVGGNYRQVEYLGNDGSGLSITEGTSSSGSSQNRIFDSAKSYKVTITEV